MKKIKKLSYFTRKRVFYYNLGDTFRLLFYYIKFFKVSKSQLGQDIWVLYRTRKVKADKYFVEVGACYPVKLSNTYLLEQFNFSGLLIEPNPNLISSLQERRSASVLECAISSNKKSIILDLATEPEFSMPDDKSIEKHRLFESTGLKKKVKAMTLTDALRESKAPKNFTYLSIDIEGYEYDALLSLDFKNFAPLLISVEHNYREDRVKIETFLNLNGYIKDPAVRISKWDDFYINRDFLIKSRDKI
jgi:FkbM family methyltransferase